MIVTDSAYVLRRRHFCVFVPLRANSDLFNCVKSHGCYFCIVHVCEECEVCANTNVKEWTIFCTQMVCMVAIIWSGHMKLAI